MTEKEVKEKIKEIIKTNKITNYEHLRRFLRQDKILELYYLLNRNTLKIEFRELLEENRSNTIKKMKLMKKWYRRK